MTFFLRCIVLVFVMQSVHAQDLPRKFRKNYVGEQPAYSYQVKEESISIPAENIRIEIGSERSVVQQNNRTDVVKITVEAKTKDYFVLNAKYSYGNEEIWKIYRKGKYLVREERLPRPETLLNMEKKRCFFRR